MCEASRRQVSGGEAAAAALRVAFGPREPHLASSRTAPGSEPSGREVSGHRL